MPGADETGRSLTKIAPSRDFHHTTRSTGGYDWL